jgi:flagellar protein FlaG
MSMAITPPGGPGGFQPPSRVNQTAADQPAFSVATTDVPEPVVTGIDHAAKRYEDLRAQGRELHFRVGHTGAIVVDVCDLEGNVIRTVPPETALDIIGGAPTE